MDNTTVKKDKAIDTSVPVGTPISDVADEFASQNLEAAWNRWKCLNCGHVYEGSESLQVCPNCGNADPDKFGDVD